MLNRQLNICVYDCLSVILNLIGKLEKKLIYNSISSDHEVCK